MIKRLLLIFILLMPIVSAELVIQGPSQTTFNLGDEINVFGYVLQPSNMVAQFKLILSCGSDRLLMIRTISLSANIKKEFSETFPITYLEDESCKIKAVLQQGNNILEQSESNEFTISKQLSGNFEINKNILRLGEELKITGEVYKLNGNPIDGTGTIYFKQENEDYLIDSIQITDGAFTYITQTRENPAGIYSIEFQANDISGNQETFLVGTFEIISTINISAEINKLHVLPKEKIKIFGEASILDKPIEKGKVRITLEEQEYSVDLVKSSFTHTILIPEDIASGKHDIEVFIEDEYGNTGSAEVSIIVIPKYSGIEILKDKDSYYPGDIVKVTPILRDQAGDIIEKEVVIKIHTPDKKEAITDKIMSNSLYEFTLLSNAPPGTWVVEILSDSIKERINIFVNEKTQLEYTLINQTLLITNIGNIEFDGPIKIELKGFEKATTLIKDISIDVNETVKIPLWKDVKTGVYDIQIEDKRFTNVEIVGKPKKDHPWIIYVLILIVLLIIIFLLLNIKKYNIQRLKRKMEIRKIIRENRKLASQKGPKSEKESIKDFEIKMSMELDNKKKPLSFRFKKSKGDSYIYELPKKKESTSYPEYREYKEPSYSSYSRLESKEESQDVTKKKKGLFDMFG